MESIPSSKSSPVVVLLDLVSGVFICIRNSAKLVFLSEQSECSNAGRSATPSLMLALLCIALLPAPRRVACNADDRAALLRIKSQLGDPVQLSSWLPSVANCYAWDPPAVVFCSASGRVTGLALSSLVGLRAPVPPPLGELTELVILQVQSVRGLSGPIPPSLANLTRLENLNIAGTSISGPVPDFLSASLRTIVIADGKLAGPTPQSLSSLPNLRYLDLSGNMLTGSIPGGLLHGSFRFLILANNRLTGEIPSDQGDADVDTIDLSRNGLAGDPSPFLFRTAKRVAKVDLSWNELEFDMTGVKFPHHLRFLDLSHNRINGSVAKSLRDVRLEHFDVSDNGLCGEIPKGRFMSAHGPECYERNRCLCGAPLPPCTATVAIDHVP